MYLLFVSLCTINYYFSLLHCFRQSLDLFDFPPNHSYFCGLNVLSATDEENDKTKSVLKFLRESSKIKNLMNQRNKIIHSYFFCLVSLNTQ